MEEAYSNLKAAIALPTSYRSTLLILRPSQAITASADSITINTQKHSIQAKRKITDKDKWMSLAPEAEAEAPSNSKAEAKAKLKSTSKKSKTKALVEEAPVPLAATDTDALAQTQIRRSSTPARRRRTSLSLQIWSRPRHRRSSRWRECYWDCQIEHWWGSILGKGRSRRFSVYGMGE